MLVKQLLVRVDQVEDLLETDVLHLPIVLEEVQQVRLQSHPHVVH